MYIEKKNKKVMYGDFRGLPIKSENKLFLVVIIRLLSFDRLEIGLFLWILILGRMIFLSLKLKNVVKLFCLCLTYR
jgi:hypothetical protein